jgi:hypothetical protein
LTVATVVTVEQLSREEKYGLNFKHENGFFTIKAGSEGRGIFTVGKCGAKFKILKCLKQTLFSSNLL